MNATHYNKSDSIFVNMNTEPIEEYDYHNFDGYSMGKATNYVF